MIRQAIALACLVALPAAAQQQTLPESRMQELRQIVDEIAAIETGPVPDLLLRATIAATEPDHLSRTPTRSALTRQLANMRLERLGALRTLERETHQTALATLLGERLSAGKIAAVYTVTVYYGRNCHGYADAARGLARQDPADADDSVWLALAALPRSPTWYLRDRVALKDRIADIIDRMEDANLVSEDTAERLENLPTANLDAGNGCRN